MSSGLFTHVASAAAAAVTPAARLFGFFSLKPALQDTIPQENITTQNHYIRE